MEISGRKVSFTDLWGLIVEYFLQQKVKEFTFGSVLLIVFQVGALPIHMFCVKKPITLYLCELFWNRWCGINIGSSHLFLSWGSQHPSLVKNYEVV